MSTKLLAHSGLLSFFSHTPVVGTSVDYSTGDLMDAKITLADAVKFAGGGGLIQSVVILSRAKLGINKDVIFFDSDPAATTFTDNAEFAIADADLSKIIGIAQITAWNTFKDNEMGAALDLAMPFVLPAASADLFAAIVERGTANYVTNVDLTLRVGIMAA